MKKTILIALLLSTHAYAQAPLIIRSMIQKPTTIGFQLPAGMTNEIAMQTEFEVSSDAPFLVKARPLFCDQLNCHVEIPAIFKVHNVKVRYGTAAWSNVWQIDIVDCCPLAKLEDLYTPEELYTITISSNNTDPVPEPTIRAPNSVIIK